LNSKSHPTIGILGTNLFLDGYENEIWSSVIQKARSMKINLLNYAGGGLDDWYHNKTIKLVSTKMINGIIAISGTIGRISTDEQLNEFCNLFNPLPVVSIGRTAGTVNLLLDNKNGIHQIMDHLINVHHYRRIAYIGGPPNNAEAQLRLQAYLEALSENQIPYDPDYVFHGNFWGDTGSQAISVFLDERKITPEAIVAANDLMATYALMELQCRGYRVPEEIAVTGFDDTLYARTVKPSLTTMSQPFVSFGETAITTIAALVNGESFPTNIYLKPQLIIRHSCGCGTHNNIIELNLTQTLDPDSSFLNNTINALEEKIPEIAEMLNLDPSLKWSWEFVDAFNRSLKNSTNDFEAILHEYVNLGLQNGLSATPWIKTIDLLEESYKKHPNYDQYQNQIYELTKTAYKIIGLISDEFLNSRYNRLETNFNIIHRIYWAINFRFEGSEIDKLIPLADLAPNFQQMNINSFFLALYDENNPTLAKINSYFNNSTNIKLHKNDEAFLAQNLIPGELYQEEPGFSYIILPIMQIGYALYESSHLDVFNNNVFFILINNAIKLLLISSEIIKYTQELEEKVEKRTQQLKEVQQQMLETAHQAGMAEIAIGVMHNIGNLLNSINISAEQISNTIKNTKIDGLLKANELLIAHQNNLAEYFTSDKSATHLPKYYNSIGQSLKSDQSKITSEILELKDRINLIDEIIQNLQDHARNNFDTVLELKSDLTDLVETALKIETSRIIKYNIQVIKNYASLDPYLVQRTKLIHILVNIIKNAIEAMENTPSDERVLTLDLLLDQEERPVIKIKDTGHGISPETVTKLFTYRFTTKKNGHGFGLHTCANYLTEIGGSISVDSEGVGKGATFTIVLPKR